MLSPSQLRQMVGCPPWLDLVRLCPRCGRDFRRACLRSVQLMRPTCRRGTCRRREALRFAIAAHCHFNSREHLARSSG
jgi:hypothetical protein